MTMRRWTSPQPYEDLDHTADVGLRVTGADPAEVLARLVLGFGQLVAGGGPVAATIDETVTIPPADDAAVLAVDVVRAAAAPFFDAHRIPVAVAVTLADPAAGAQLVVTYGPWDDDAHADGLDIKAVTWHAAHLEPAPSGDGWVGQVVFDI